MNNINIELTQEEADLIFIQLIHRMDAFDELIRNTKNTNNIINYAKAKETIGSVVDKLQQGGAQLN